MSVPRLFASVLLSRNPHLAYTAFKIALVHTSWRLQMLRRSYVGTRCCNMVSPLEEQLLNVRSRSQPDFSLRCASVLFHVTAQSYVRNELRILYSPIYSADTSITSEAWSLSYRTLAG